MRIFNYSIILVVCLTFTNSNQKAPETLKFSINDAIRRDGVSYTTSVLHQNPKYPDQHAESNVKVDFHTNQPKQIVRINKSIPVSYQRVPKALPTYSSQQVSHQYLGEQFPQSDVAYPSVIQSSSYNPAQTQSFNVGYSVSIAGGAKPQTPSPIIRQRHESAEIITGSRNDAIQKPISEMSAEEFVNHALIDLKKQKLSGIKPKYHKYSNDKDTDAKRFIANLAPKTQKYLSYLGDTNPISTHNHRFRPSNVAQAASTVSSWVNLSPTVEIYHSKNLPQGTKFSRAEQNEHSKMFNHAAAIEKSQGFDYSNALESQSGSESDKTQVNNIDQNYAEHFGSSATNTLSVFNNQQPLTAYRAIPVIPYSTSPNPQFAETQNLPTSKLPVDTSLLREPVLMPKGNNLPNNPNSLAIPFDATLLQAMHQKLINSEQVPSQSQLPGHVPILYGNSGIAPYNGQLENAQAQPLYNLNQLVQAQPQQGYQFDNNYRGQQQALFLKNDFDTFFDKKLEQMQPKTSGFENVAPKRTKVNNKSKSLRNIETDLRPPPVKLVRHRRIYLGKSN